MSQQGHLFRHSFLQGTVTLSQSVHPLGAPVTLHELLITFIFLDVSHTPEVRGEGRGFRSPVLPLSLPPQEITARNFMPALQERRESLSQSASLPLLYLFCTGPTYTGPRSPGPARLGSPTPSKHKSSCESLEEGRPLTWEPQGSHISVAQLHPSACSFNLTEFCFYHTVLQQGLS